MKIGDINPLDKRFWPVDPDPDFNPERNRLVIERTIKKYEEQRARKQGDFVDKLKERTDAVASWLTSSHGAESMKPMDRYFSKRYLAHLRGQEIVKEIKGRLGLIPKKISQIFDSEGKMKGLHVQTKQRQGHPEKKRHTVVIKRTLSDSGHRPKRKISDA